MNLQQLELDRLAKAARDAWVARKKIQYPDRTYESWEEMSEFDRETDRHIAIAVLEAHANRRKG